MRRWFGGYMLARAGASILGALGIAVLTLGFHSCGQPFSRGDRGHYSAPAGVQQASSSPTSCPGHAHYWYPPC